MFGFTSTKTRQLSLYVTMSISTSSSKVLAEDFILHFLNELQQGFHCFYLYRSSALLSNLSY